MNLIELVQVCVTKIKAVLFIEVTLDCTDSKER